MQGIVNNKNFEQLLLSHWTEILDKNLLIKAVLEITRDSDFTVLTSENVPAKKFEFTITKFAMADQGFDLWVEFSVPKQEGMVIGTYVFQLGHNDLQLKESYGTLFLPKT